MEAPRILVSAKQGSKGTGTKDTHFYFLFLIMTKKSDIYPWDKPHRPLFAVNCASHLIVKSTCVVLYIQYALCTLF